MMKLVMLLVNQQGTVVAYTDTLLHSRALAPDVTAKDIAERYVVPAATQCIAVWRERDK